MAFIRTKTSNHGTENPIVARLSVQSRQLMIPFALTTDEKDNIWRILHYKIQVRLLACCDIWSAISAREAEIANEIELEGVKTQSNGRVATLDTIDDLERSADEFLYSAKSVLRDTKSMVCEFFTESKKKRRELEDGNYGNLKEWAEGRFGSTDPLTNLLAEDLDLWIDEVFSKRNAVEHPGGRAGSLHVSNFSAVQHPDTKAWMGTSPTWARNQDQPTSITNDMLAMIENMLCFTEDVLVECLRKSDSMIPVFFYEIPEKDRDPTCPIRLQVTMDREKLKPSGDTEFSE